jgi:hypothetical protein
MAAAGMTPPGWALSSERFFLQPPAKGLVGSAHAVPTNAELVAAMVADPVGVEDAEEFAALVTGHPAYKGPYVPEARPGWRQQRYRFRSPSLCYYTRLWLQAADHDLTAAERGEAERRAGLAEALPLSPPFKTP